MRFFALLLCVLVLPVQAQLRVVSLAPSLTEIMLELDAGDLLVGLLDGGERPAALVHVPSVGHNGVLEMEGLLALKPDLLLLWPASISAAQQQQLRQFGIPTFTAEPHNLEQLATQFVEIGERIGRVQQGRALQQRFRVKLAQLRQRYAREQPLEVFYQVWDSPLYTIGGNQIISDALNVCGARNIFADLALPAPQVGVETVLKRDPEVLLAASVAQLVSWQRWPQLHAVRLGQLWVVPDDGLERPSFQMLAATEKLCRLLATAQQ